MLVENVVFRLSFEGRRRLDHSRVENGGREGRGRLEVVEEVLEYLCTKFCRSTPNGSAAVARRSRGSNGVNGEVLEGGGSGLTLSTAAEGPLECLLSGRD